ncbi:MAG: ribonuclease Y [Pirellulaceae bacterium]
MLIAVGAAVVAIALNWLAGKLLGLQRKKAAQAAGQIILDHADQDAKNRLREAELEAKEQMIRVRAETEKEMAASREELREREHTLDKRQESVDQQGEDLRKQEQIVESNQRRLTERLGQADSRREELDKLLDTQRQSLHELSSLNREQATDRLLTLLADELSQEVGTLVLKHHKEVKEVCDQQARDILLTAMQRYASAHTADSTTSTVDIPNDEMKGRIIGREGRNIRAFEKATGIDVIIDDTPGVVIVSGFDPVRREIGRQALNQLIADGRIHPSRIEEVVQSTSKEIDKFMEKKGEEAALEVNILGLPKPIIAMLGRLHFRTSYSQNVLRHSIEVSHLSGMLAEMVGLNGDVGRRCGLLHDIGKAADHELEGGHPKIGADLLKRHKESVEVVHAAFGHHDEIITEYPYTMLVATADACSASRPGARRESLERYIKRMEELETIAKGFSGVEQAFAIQAGRELRVLACARETNDQSAAKICRDIAKAFEEQLTYPGEIKVTVVRESRFSEIAR